MKRNSPDSASKKDESSIEVTNKVKIIEDENQNGGHRVIKLGRIDVLIHECLERLTQRKPIIIEDQC